MQIARRVGEAVLEVRKDALGRFLTFLRLDGPDQIQHDDEIDEADGDQREDDARRIRHQ